MTTLRSIDYINTSRDFSNDIVKTCNEMKAAMLSDKYNEGKQNSVEIIIKIVLRSVEYIQDVAQQVISISSDGQININDLPAILTIVTKSKDFLISVIKDGVDLVQSLKADSMKYITLGVIYFVLLTLGANDAMLEQVKSCYSTLWELVTFDSAELVVKVKKCFPCCPCWKKTTSDVDNGDLVKSIRPKSANTREIVKTVSV